MNKTTVDDRDLGYPCFRVAVYILHLLNKLKSLLVQLKQPTLAQLKQLPYGKQKSLLEPLKPQLFDKLMPLLPVSVPAKEPEKKKQPGPRPNSFSVPSSHIAQGSIFHA